MRQHLQSKIFKKDSQQLAEQSDTGKMPKGGGGGGKFSQVTAKLEEKAFKAGAKNTWQEALLNTGLGLFQLAAETTQHRTVF